MRITYRDHEIELTPDPSGDTSVTHYSVKHTSTIHLRGVLNTYDEALNRAKADIDIIMGDRIAEIAKTKETTS